MRIKNLVIPAIAIASLLLVGAGIFWFLITPRNPITDRFRGQFSYSGAKVIVGPYPDEADLRKLRRQGVTNIVSLLNPQLPYENVLIEREREIAKKLGLDFVNYPMTSLWGRAVGDEYEQNATSAALTVVHAPGKAYLHCYLGIHRAKAVEERIAKMGQKTTKFADREGERDATARAFDSAQRSYDSGEYSEAIKTLLALPDLNPSGKSLLGWSYLKSNQSADARRTFEDILTTSTPSADVRSGLGFAALRMNDLPVAEEQFIFVQQETSDSLSALEGLGLVRYRQGRADEARELLRRLVEKDASNGEAKAILERLGPP